MNKKTRFLKISFVALTVMASSVSVCAQENEDKKIFNHLSIGVNVGTPGIGLDVAMPAGHYVQLRAGFAVIPTFKASSTLDINQPSIDIEGVNINIPPSVDIEGKTGFTNGKILVDVYPFKKSSFHLTAGAYFGSSKIVEAYNKENGVLSDIVDYNNQVSESEKIGYELGDYLLTPDANGNINTNIKTASFKPYAGLGFGRSVPNKRVGFMFEMGCMFWNSPKLYCNGERLTDNNVSGEAGGIIKTMSKITVYPVINFRICGKLF